mmetsp:Transcript_82806/g.222098  ORF Transcript_82806/g.222098 Transcript_82806/m.222098 type:complete len:83 (+) Transcript_82806:406-654(+)
MPRLQSCHRALRRRLGRLGGQKGPRSTRPIFFLNTAQMIGSCLVTRCFAVPQFAPEEAFLAKVKGIKGVSQVETQTYTLMPQ